MTTQARTITRQEQEETGLIRRSTASNFVAPMPAQPPVHIPTNHEINLTVPSTVQEVVHVQTSASDRAKGFHQAFMPIAFAFGVAAILISLSFENGLFTLATFTFFWITFLLTWTVGWVWTNIISPEFAGLYYVRRQWNHADNEQYERWEHYKWMAGRPNNDRRS